MENHHELRGHSGPLSLEARSPWVGDQALLIFLVWLEHGATPSPRMDTSIWAPSAGSL